MYSKKICTFCNKTILRVGVNNILLAKTCIMFPNEFDNRIIQFTNQFVHKSVIFDEAIVFLSDCMVLKGGVMMTGIWWIWFKEKKTQRNSREHIISTLVGSFVAMFIVRILATKIPFRARPILNPENHLISAYSFEKLDFNFLSSFPSDHATLFFALSAGLFYSSRKLGIFALVYTSLFIAFPRIYLGLHYPTDILAGATIGVVSVVVFNSKHFKDNISSKLLDMSMRKEHYFYPLFFLLTYQIADMFNSTRNLLTFLGHWIKLWL